MTTIRSERPTEAPAREALLDLAYGPARFSKPSQRLREGRPPALALVAIEEGRLVGTVRLWPVLAGHSRALLLGPLAVHPDFRRRGIGAALMRRAIGAARRAGQPAVLLVGDASYYARFGFTAAQAGGLSIGGAVAPARLLGLELVRGALDGARGALRTDGGSRPAPIASDVAHAA